MTYVTEQTPQQLRAHMRRLKAMPGWHDPLSDRLFKEILALDAEVKRLREAVQLAYGYLWHVNNEPGTPNRHYPEAMAYEARKVLRDLLTTEQRGDGINAARAALSHSQDDPTGVSA